LGEKRSLGLEQRYLERYQPRNQKKGDADTEKTYQHLALP
jgi:hypothetical protein